MQKNNSSPPSQRRGPAQQGDGVPPYLSLYYSDRSHMTKNNQLKCSRICNIPQKEFRAGNRAKEKWMLVFYATFKGFTKKQRLYAKFSKKVE